MQIALIPTASIISARISRCQSEGRVLSIQSRCWRGPDRSLTDRLPIFDPAGVGFPHLQPESDYIPQALFWSCWSTPMKNDRHTKQHCHTLFLSVYTSLDQEQVELKNLHFLVK